MPGVMNDFFSNLVLGLSEFVIPISSGDIFPCKKIIQKSTGSIPMTTSLAASCPSDRRISSKSMAIPTTTGVGV